MKASFPFVQFTTKYEKEENLVSSISSAYTFYWYSKISSISVFIRKLHWNPSNAPKNLRVKASSATVWEENSKNVSNQSKKSSKNVWKLNSTTSPSWLSTLSLQPLSSSATLKSGTSSVSLHVLLFFGAIYLLSPEREYDETIKILAGKKVKIIQSIQLSA